MAQMIAQAAHIPVHLGAMPASVRAALQAFEHWAPGDLVVLNDPYLGGTHLPDITMVSPVFVEGLDTPSFFVASRAHHADVGGMSPGSMPLATEIYQEGLIMPPVKLVEAGQINQAASGHHPAQRAHPGGAPRGPGGPDGRPSGGRAAPAGDRSPATACRKRCHYAHGLLAYAERLTRAAIARIPDGVYAFGDEMDDDGTGSVEFSLHGPRLAEEARQNAAGAAGQGPQIRVEVTVDGDHMIVDFTGSSPAVAGAHQCSTSHHRVGDLVLRALRGRR